MRRLQCSRRVFFGIFKRDLHLKAVSLRLKMATPSPQLYLSSVPSTVKSYEEPKTLPVGPTHSDGKPRVQAHLTAFSVAFSSHVIPTLLGTGTVLTQSVGEDDNAMGGMPPSLAASGGGLEVGESAITRAGSAGFLEHVRACVCSRRCAMRLVGVPGHNGEGG